MPTLTQIDGVKIEMFYREHPPAHVHVSYSGDKAVIAIVTGAVIGGRLPAAKLALAQRWVAANREDLLARWNSYNPARR